MSQEQKNFVELRKKITQPFLLSIINQLSTEWYIPHTEVCYRLLIESLRREIENRKKNKDANESDNQA